MRVGPNGEKLSVSVVIRQLGSISGSRIRISSDISELGSMVIFGGLKGDGKYLGQLREAW